MSDIVSRLRELAATKAGESPPEWFSSPNWAEAMSVLLREAADEIERLRRLAGAVTQGEGFRDIREQTKRPSGFGETAA